MDRYSMLDSGLIHDSDSDSTIMNWRWRRVINSDMIHSWRREYHIHGRMSSYDIIAR